MPAVTKARVIRLKRVPVVCIPHAPFWINDAPA
jgi:hypothetical protein